MDSASKVNEMFGELQSKAAGFGISFDDETQQKLGVLEESTAQNAEILNDPESTPEQKEAAQEGLDLNKQELKDTLAPFTPPMFAGMVNGEIDKNYDSFSDGGEGEGQEHGRDPGGMDLSQSPLLAVMMLVVGMVSGNSELMESAKEALGMETEKSADGVDGQEVDEQAPDEQAIENQELEEVAATQEASTERTDGLLVPDNVPAPDELEPNGMGESLDFDPNAELGEGQEQGAGISGLGDIGGALGAGGLMAALPEILEAVGGLFDAMEQGGGAVAEAEVADLGEMPEPPMPEGAVVASQDAGISV